MNYLSIIKKLSVVATLVFSFGCANQNLTENIKSIYDVSVVDIDGNIVSLSNYKGKVVMIVNVASKCNFTPQYEGLQKLYKKYKSNDFVVLGFPANNFLWQEPADNSEIKSFCSLNYNVTFPMFSKISVKGKDQAILYQFLTSKIISPKFGGKIKWNFTKFLINKDGDIVGRFEPSIVPNDTVVITEIEKLLK